MDKGKGRKGDAMWFPSSDLNGHLCAQARPYYLNPALFRSKKHPRQAKQAVALLGYSNTL